MRLLLSTILFTAILSALAHAADPVSDYNNMANFAVLVSSQFSLEKLGATGEPAATFATALPADARGLSMVGFRSKDGLYFRIAAAASEGKDVHRPYLAVQVGTGKPGLLTLDPAIATAPVASVGVWSPGQPATAGAVLIVSFASSEPDLPLLAFAIDPSGAVSRVDLGGAKSLAGTYDLRDLDGDGSYELLTERILDGWAGGITYKAVRTYDAQSRSYQPEPEKYKDFYRGELKYYDWVLDTRGKMLESPESYMSQQERGHFFAADYNGQTVGFDSLVPLEDIPDAGGDIQQWNQRVENAVKRVTEYRDQLKAWLDGGSVYPSAWQMRK
jgi:hypothetical protein